MNDLEIAKTVVVLILVFPFILLFSYLGYLLLFGAPSIYPDPGDPGFRALVLGCAVGLAVGTIIGHRIEIEKKQQEGNYAEKN